MIAPWYGAKDGGGVAIAIENLVHGLLSRGAKVFVVKIIGDGWRPRFSRGTQNELIVRLPLRGRSEFAGAKALIGYYLRLPILVATLLVLRLVTRFQLVNFHYHIPPYDLLRRIFRFLNYKFVTGFQGSDVMVAPEHIPTREALGHLVRDAEKIIGVSRALINRLTQMFPDVAAKCSVIQNTVDVDFLTSVSTTPAPGESEFDLLFVGGLIPVKGPDQLIASLHNVVQNRPNTVLCLCGTGAMEEELKDTIRSKSLESNVKFAGFVPHLELINFYNRTRLVVIPSRSEGFPHVAMEAAICGRPVVAFNVGGLNELILDGASGILVPPNDVDEFANAILRLLDSPSLTELMGVKAKTRGTQAFDPSTMSQSYLNLYRAVINHD